jgi:hypothetical protein
VVSTAKWLEHDGLEVYMASRTLYDMRRAWSAYEYLTFDKYPVNEHLAFNAYLVNEYLASNTYPVHEYLAFNTYLVSEYLAFNTYKKTCIR